MLRLLILCLALPTVLGACASGSPSDRFALAELCEQRDVPTILAGHRALRDDCLSPDELARQVRFERHDRDDRGRSSESASNGGGSDGGGSDGGGSNGGGSGPGGDGGDGGSPQV